MYAFKGVSLGIFVFFSSLCHLEKPNLVITGLMSYTTYFSFYYELLCVLYFKSLSTS